MATPANNQMFATSVQYYANGTLNPGTYWLDPMYLDSHQRNWEYRVLPADAGSSAPLYQYRTIDILQCHAMVASQKIGGETYQRLIKDQHIDSPNTHNTNVGVTRHPGGPLDSKATGRTRDIIIWEGTWSKQSIRTSRDGITTTMHIVLRQITSGADPDFPDVPIPGFNGGWIDIPNPTL